MNFNIYFVTVLVVITNGINGDEQNRCKRQTGNTCFLMPQIEEGPYYWNATYNRADITENCSGIPFTLRIKVIEVGTCEPIPKAAVDIWHCDAVGIYSHYINASLSDNGRPPPGMNGTRPPGPPPGMNGTRPPGPPWGGNRITDNTTFLRGLQVTNNDGEAIFSTIYPGWYTGRATHVHIKVHINGTTVNETGVYTGGYVSHTGQIFFDDAFTDKVALVAPYTSHNVTRLLNNLDRIFTRQGGNYSVLSVGLVQENIGLSGGVIATITVGINSSAIPDPIQGGFGPPPTPPPPPASTNPPTPPPSSTNPPPPPPSSTNPPPPPPSSTNPPPPPPSSTNPPPPPPSSTNPPPPPPASTNPPTPPSSTDPPTTTRPSNGNTFTMMSSTLILLQIVFYVYTILE